jgi:hypothetical protein
MIGVDTFTGDVNSNFKDDHFQMTKNLLSEFPNIKLVQSDYRDFIENNTEIYDIIHVDIVHDYENTYKCGEWSINHSKVTLFHDTMTFPEVMQACQDLASKYNLDFYNYPHCNGLGILYNKNVVETRKFTFGWISHNQNDFQKFLEPSLKRLEKGGIQFDTISVTDELKISANYNKIIDKCQTRWLILCHEDVAFSWDFLSCIEKTVNYNPEYNLFGFVGANEQGSMKSNSQALYSLETCDSCFIVIDLQKNKNKFDESTFDDYHLQVEDFCMQAGGKAKTLLVDYLEEEQFIDMHDIEERASWVYHQSTTCKNNGFWWGEYQKYIERLNKKWGKMVSTT